MPIRRLTPDDADGYRGIRLRSLADAPEAFGSDLRREVDLPPAAWRDRLGNGATFVAEDGDGAWVGLLTALPEEGRVHLVGMWVDPRCRGDGTAAALVEAAADLAVDEGLDVLHLHVSDGNDRARRFYRRVGFEETGAADDFGRLLGVEMVRRLRPSPRTPAGPTRPTSGPG